MNDANTVAELIALEHNRGAALVARDAAALDALFPDDLVHIHTTGQQMNKQELLHYVLHVLQFLAVTRADLKVAVHGDVAVMTGKMRNTMKRVDKPEPVTTDALVTQVWVRTGSGWRQSNFHACRAAAPGQG
ncbi:MAG: nuclear transport factor 2 family protein [Steroidobacteraceae bacterium]